MGKKKIKWHIKGLNLTDKYRLSIYNDTNYEEFLHFQLKGREVLVALAISIVILITATTVLIAFTPIREFIPGYPDETTRKMMQNNVLKADSLEKVINEWTVYVNNSIRVLSGNSTQILQNPPDSSFATKTFQDVRSRQDSIFRTQIEKEEQFNFKSNSQNKENDISEIHFITPLKGKITSSFDMGENHLGVDIVSSPDDIVLAVLEGTVIMSEWTVETGNVIQIQHSNNLISIYKHNARLLKKQGSKVKAGDAIAIVGNTGELTSGHHLHFELWYKGVPLNPEQYIVF